MMSYPSLCVWPLTFNWPCHDKRGTLQLSREYCKGSELSPAMNYLLHMEQFLLDAHRAGKKNKKYSIKKYKHFNTKSKWKKKKIKYLWFLFKKFSTDSWLKKFLYKNTTILMNFKVVNILLWNAIFLGLFGAYSAINSCCKWNLWILIYGQKFIIGVVNQSRNSLD